ncbi:uncharacterized protein [Zea mays]|uniref:uncharacterized protein n=1 Tax=Zea mays TaxID=4577 RepID=UPI0009A9D1B3|nr:uncharacterized protein LOC103647155 [Zea mays]|eukprot:XP_020404928.1 uncharacterized protein LOC103647155 [Zea mays]
MLLKILLVIMALNCTMSVLFSARQSMFYLQQASRHQAVRMEMFFGSFLSESVSPQNLFGHPNVERCPFLNQYHRIDVRTEPALPFNPLAARAATISLSAFGPFGFGFFNGKGKR